MMATSATPFVLIVGHNLFNALLVILGRGTVVAGKSDHKDFCVRKILERPVATVNAGEIELRGGSAQWQRGKVICYKGLAEKCQAREKYRDQEVHHRSFSCLMVRIESGKDCEPSRI
jgi:hypothetical protein